MRANTDSGLIFKPAASKGGAYTILFSMGMISLLCSVLTFAIIQTGDPALTISSLLLIGGMGALFSILIFGYYSMTFSLTPTLLTLRWAFFRTKIPLEEITSIGKPSSNKFDGLKSGGAALPHHYYGGFRLLIDGTFKPIKLVATDLTRLVILATRAGKFYGITPATPGDFIASVRQLNNHVLEKVFDTTSPVALPASITSKYRLISRSMFIAALSLAGVTLVLFSLAYTQLPAIVPLHFNISGVPDRWGSKEELLWFAILFLAIATAFNLLLYLAINQKSQLKNSKLGPLVMLIPLLIMVTFSIILPLLAR